MQKPPPEPYITEDMTVLDVVSNYRSTEEVFRRYDSRARKCICCTCLFETIKDVALTYDLDLDAFLRDLEGAALRDAAKISS